ncbi:zinc finger protein CONSTANS-LIKE 4-like isoform X2 [Mangifera indica]|uniref:zinc finger protein CONSTANS-LIKE 4-like isoform X2 n=1 Tax=Mangifera indica TaxID=29780 RepID=UPI001CFB4AAA|nr:zinc finger protein CONSTANS-LIKE 4-like isoform X2 [Mangifera indica]
MYAQTDLFFPYLQNFSQDFQQLEEYCKSNKPYSSLSNSVQLSTISDYDLGGEGDLFKAPEPIIEEPLGELDPVTSAISMISCGEDVIATEGLKVANIDSIHHEQLLSEVFSEWEKDLRAKAMINAPLSEVPDIKVPVLGTDESQIQESKLLPDTPFQKSVSSGSLTSMDWVHGTMMKPSFLEIPGMDFGSVYGMRRAFSDGDIKPVMITTFPTEDRREKLSRYRNKKTKRNFGRRIKYACRKALADSQPRIRGRFAKTEEPDMSRRQELFN